MKVYHGHTASSDVMRRVKKAQLQNIKALLRAGGLSNANSAEKRLISRKIG